MIEKYIFMASLESKSIFSWQNMLDFHNYGIPGLINSHVTIISVEIRCARKADIPGWKLYLSKHLRKRWNSQRWDIVMLQDRTERLEINVIDTEIKKWEWKYRSIRDSTHDSINFLLTEMVGFIKLHCIQVNSIFFQTACPSKKKQWCVCETQIFPPCSMQFYKPSMAKMVLFTVPPWTGDWEKECNKKNCKTIIIYVLPASSKTAYVFSNF